MLLPLLRMGSAVGVVPPPPGRGGDAHGTPLLFEPAFSWWFMTEIVVALLMVTGALFMLVAALGILRMPDVYMRMSCNAKAVTIGLGLLLLAFALHFGEVGLSSRALATMAFVILTVPVASHRIGRSAYLSGAPLWDQTRADEWRGGDDGGGNNGRGEEG